MFLEDRLPTECVEVIRMKDMESGISALDERRALLCHL